MKRYYKAPDRRSLENTVKQVERIKAELAGAEPEGFPHDEEDLLSDGHPINPRASFVGADTPPPFPKVFSLAYLLH